MTQGIQTPRPCLVILVILLALVTLAYFGYFWLLLVTFGYFGHFGHFGHWAKALFQRRRSTSEASPEGVGADSLVPLLGLELFLTAAKLTHRISEAKCRQKKLELLSGLRSDPFLALTSGFATRS